MAEHRTGWRAARCPARPGGARVAGTPAPRRGRTRPSRESQETSMETDHCVIGGGIVGLATAMALLERRPGAGLVLLEKEPRLARHQTGHNSGVIHSGIYYQPGSVKAELCRRGAEATKAFCADHGIPVAALGKLLVATDARDAARMAGLEERARQNRIDAVRLTGSELRALEPHVAGVGALLVEATASVDYTRVCAAMEEVVRAAGGRIELGVEVSGITESPTAVSVVGTASGAAERRWTARRLVVCAGLQSDRLGRVGRGL